MTSCLDSFSTDRPQSHGTGQAFLKYQIFNHVLIPHADKHSKYPLKRVSVVRAVSSITDETQTWEGTGLMVIHTPVWERTGLMGVHTSGNWSDDYT